MLIGSSFPHFKDSNGDPLDAGYIFFGQPNLNPEINPVTVYWDSALTQPASQPILTLNGYITRDGAIANLFASANYSITVKNKVGILLYSLSDSNYFDPSSSFNLVTGKTVDNIAALKQLPKTGAPYAFVLGYYAKGDGGGGQYYYDSTDTSSTDNGGTIIVAADGGRWKLIYHNFVTLRQFGAKGNSNGSTGNGQDDTAYIQAAITWASTTTMRKAELWAEEGIYRTTATLTAAAPFKLKGIHPIAKKVGGADFGGGTFIYFDHLNKGFSCTNGGGYYTDTSFESFGTCRNQPAPAASWSPANNDFDFYLYGIADIRFNDILMLNATNGIGLYGNPSNGPGRLEMFNIRSQSFKQGIVIDTTYDVTRMDHIHFWPFWRDDSNVHAYTMNNLDAIYSLRNDNPMLSNIFTIFARAGLRIGQGANGGSSKIHLLNADFDRGCYGIWIDASVTGCTGQYDNITHQGETGFVASKAIFVQGNNSTLQIGDFSSEYSWQNGVRVEGTGNVVTFGHAKVVNFDQGAANFPAFEALAGNYITFATRPFVANSGGSGERFAATGTIVCDEWRSFSPVVSSQTGTITTLGAVSGYYKLVGNTVHVEYDITITTNGTAAGDIRFDCPLGSAIHNFAGSGREVAVNGKTHTPIVQAGGNKVILTNYDNTYVGADGVRLVGCVEYDINVGI